MQVIRKVAPQVHVGTRFATLSARGPHRAAGTRSRSRGRRLARPCRSASFGKPGWRSWREIPRAVRPPRCLQRFPGGWFERAARMLRERLRHVRSAASRPPSERRKEMPGLVAPFRNGDALNVSKGRPTPRLSPVEIGRQPGRAAEQAALRDALELVGGIHAAAARLRQASYRTPMQKRREEERARHSGFGALA